MMKEFYKQDKYITANVDTVYLFDVGVDRSNQSFLSDTKYSVRIILLLLLFVCYVFRINKKNKKISLYYRNQQVGYARIRINVKPHPRRTE